jgi:glycosyltransferase involved in cell wall biosynthesis
MGIVTSMEKFHIKSTQVCLEYVPQCGGSAIAGRDYAAAMESAVIAFTSFNHMNCTEGWDKNVLRIPIRSDFLGRWYALPRFNSELKAAKSVLCQSDIAVLHLLYRYHVQWAGAVLHNAKIPYWVIPHGSLDPWAFTYRALQKKIWLRTIGCPIMRRAEAVIFITERERQKALPYTQGCKTRVIYLPVAFVDTSMRNQVRTEVRFSHLIPQDARVLVWIGRLHSMKRPLETIAAFKRAHDPSLHLMVIGPDDGLTRQDCERYCSEHNIGNVHLIGPVYGKRKYDYYMAADSYISLSHRENFNYTAAEALACGLPVILSPGNDLSLELQDLNCGWMLKTSDAQEAADMIKQFASIPQAELDKMGLAGQSWARTALSWEAFVQALHKLAAESTNNRRNRA